MSRNETSDCLCGPARIYCTDFCNCGKSSLWPLLSPGLRAKMTAGFQPCPWLISEDIPRERLEPLGGGIPDLVGRRILDLVGCGGNRTPGEQPPEGSRGAIPHAREA